MKGLYVIIVLCFVGYTFGQDLQFINENGEDFTGDTVLIQTDVEEFQAGEAFFIQNNGETGVFHFARKVGYRSTNKIDLLICDDMLCYPPQEDEYWSPARDYDIAAGESTRFEPKVQSNGYTGTAEATYYVLDENDNELIYMHVIFEITETSSVQKHEKIHYSVFPNPAQNEIQVNSGSFQEGATVTLIDAVGKEVKSVLINQTKNIIDIANLYKGVYFIKVVTIDGQQGDVQRLIVQ